MSNYESLKQEIIKSYEEGVSLEEAEKLAGKFLAAQMDVANELQKADLDSRMRKSGVKAIRAAIYLEGANKDPKKPSDVMLLAQVDVNDLVQTEQRAFDEAEVGRTLLENYMNIFNNAHIFYRNLSKGKYE